MQTIDLKRLSWFSAHCRSLGLEETEEGCQQESSREDYCVTAVAVIFCAVSLGTWNREVTGCPWLKLLMNIASIMCHSPPTNIYLVLLTVSPSKGSLNLHTLCKGSTVPVCNGLVVVATCFGGPGSSSIVCTICESEIRLWYTSIFIFWYVINS